jgi:quercetin dioxygenase-like cupin family protein
MKNILMLTLCVSAILFGAVVIMVAQVTPYKTLTDPGRAKPNMLALKTGEPESLTYDGGTVRYLASSEDTHGAWSLVELTEKPGYKTRYHRHLYTDEAYYVLEGVLTAKIGDKTYTLPAGSYILIPHGTPHAQGNLGKVPVKVLLTMTPGGFEGSFRDRSTLIKTADPNDPNFVKQREKLMIEKHYDREFISDWNP